MTNADHKGERLRLLVVTSTWPLFPGDRRTPFVRDLTFDLAARGCDVEVLAPHAPGAATSEADGPVGVRRFRYMWPQRLEQLAYGGGGLINMRSPVRKLLAPPFVAAEMWAVIRSIRRFRPDAIHAHWLLPQGFAAGLCARLIDIPIVTTVHGGDVFALRSPVFRPFKRVAAALASIITCNGPAAQREVQALGAPADKMRMIRFAPSFEGKIDPEQASSWRARFAADSKLILFVGRLIPEKGPGDFIEAIAQTADARVHGVICGDGPMREELRNLAVRRGVSERVHFEGWVEPAGIACRMAASDALLFPSKRSPEGWVEAQGVVAIEAMRAGLPVLASRSGGIPDVVEHGVTGWLFEEGDVAAMARLIGACAADALPNMPAVIAQARNFASNDVTRDKTAEAFHRLFLELTAAKMPGRANGQRSPSEAGSNR